MNQQDRPGSRIGVLTVVLLFLWVLGVFWIPRSKWLLPFAGGAPTAVITTGISGLQSSALLVPPRRRDRPGRRVLATLDLEADSALLLKLRIQENPGLGLQIKGADSGEIFEVLRIQPSVEPREYLMVLDGRRLPTRIRLTLWNQGSSEVVVERGDTRPLHPSYRWAKRFYWLLGPLLLLGVGWRTRQAIGEYLRFGENGEQPSRHRAGDRIAAALIFLLTFLVFRLAPVHQVLDAKFISVVSYSLITTGAVALPGDFKPNKRARRSYTLRPVGDKVYHFFSSAPGVLNVPFVAAFEWAGLGPVGSDGQFLAQNERRILRLVAAILSAMVCALFFLIGRVWLPPGPSVALTSIFALGTQLLSTVSRPFWSHSWAILLLTMALLLLVTPRFNRRGGTYVAIATLLCWAYFCRPPMSLAIIGVTLFLWLKRRRFLAPFLGTGMIWAVLFGFYAFQTYGALLPPYFLSSHLKSGRLAGGLLLTSYPEALLGTLLSPGRGLFVYVPIFAVILFLAVRYWRWIPDRALAGAALGVCLAHWQLVSMFRNWWGGQSFGPRLMSDLIPWFFVLAVLAWAALRETRHAVSFEWSRLRIAGLILIVGLSIFINSRGAWVQETQRGAGIWNWRYPQFMAGLLPRPEAEDAGHDPPTP